MSALPTIKALAQAKPEKLHKLWEGLGYYTRVRNMQRAAKVIIDKHQGTFPDSFDDLMSLPGIGRYTAGAICSIAFNQAKPVLDGNVIRVLTRLYGIGGDPREKTLNAQLWHLSEKLVQYAAKVSNDSAKVRPPSPLPGAKIPQQEPVTCPVGSFNQAVMELGALVCTPRQPICAACPLLQLCVAFREKRVRELPTLKRRAPATTRRFVALVASNDDKFLVRQRPNGVLNAHLWEFPNFEVGLNGYEVKTEARKKLGITVSRIEPLCTIKHTITRYRITLDVFRVSTNRLTKLTHKGWWLTRAELKRLPFTSAHKKILMQVSDS